jgi:hypothetical protein
VQIANDLPVLFMVCPDTIQTSAVSLNWDQHPDRAFRLQFATLS